MYIGNSEIRVLQAGYGDCIFISIKKEDCEFNILIDGGLACTYYNPKNKRCPKGPLKLLLDELKSHERRIDLLIITHVDGDHILGICKWFESDFPDSCFVKEVWLNDDIVVNFSHDLNNTASDAASLIQMMKDRGISYKNDIVRPMCVHNDYCYIRVFAPNVVYRNVMARKIEDSLNNAASENECQSFTIRQLVQRDWNMSAISDENKASIAFELQTWDGIRLLLLGDAEYEDIIDGFNEIYADREAPLEYDLVKLSHHGSRNNFHPDFLNMLYSKYYVVSSNGNKFHLPHKEVLAQIIDKTDSSILFNYRERMEEMFCEQDYLDYPLLKDRISTI